MVSKSPHNRLCNAWTCWCTWCIDPSPRLTTWENFCESAFFFSECSHCHSSRVAKLALAAVISSKVLIAFARFVVKSKRSVMALVVFLERLVMTELEGPITNDQFLSCTSVSVSLTWDFLNEYRGLFIFEKRVMFNQEVFTGFKIYYQIVSRQSRCKMVWT